MSVKGYDSTNKILKLIAGGTLWADCPLGTINAFGGATAPEGWLLCQGQALSRTTYKDLFDVIGTSFGSGDGSTTFNLPDLRGEFLRGAGTNSRTTQGDGGNVGEHQDSTEIVYYNAHGNNDWEGTYIPGDNGVQWNEPQNIEKEIGKSGSNRIVYNATPNTFASNSPLRYSIRPTNTSVNYIMKVKQTPMPADLRAALEAALDDKDMLTWS